MQFVQSVNDFPIIITLGDVMPTWSLNRWISNTVLRFVPPDTEGFIISGNGQQRLYKGQRRSHRFINYNDTTFCHHCILEQAPTSNIISLLMEGSENFNFFYQPDTVKDPELKMSCAVYKKNFLLGEGTGKLCHIERPFIYDQTNQFTWGDLTVIGNELRITISQQFLNGAIYPVTVPIIVRTSPLGAHCGFYDDDYEEPYFDEYDCWEEPYNYYYPLYFEQGLALNRYKIPQDMYGKATAYVYLFKHDDYGLLSNYNRNVKPCFYSDNNNIPFQRISYNETFFDHEINTTTKKEGWRSTTFYTNSVLNAGSYVWFGMHCGEFQPRFDFGKKLYYCYDDDFDNNLSPPDICPVWNNDIDHWELGTLDIILSMYFNYTPMQHYVRTLTQGVNFTDSRKLTVDYKKAIKLTVNGNTVLGGYNTFVRKCISNVTNNTIVNKTIGVIRTILEQIEVHSVFMISRNIINKIIDTLQAIDIIHRTQNTLRELQDSVTSGDTVLYPVLFVRTMQENITLTDIFQHIANYIRLFPDLAENTTETKHSGDYYRNITETAHVDGIAIKGLLLFIRIVSQVFIRDYLLRRFLIAREELKLKSCITRDITLDSRID